MTENMEVLQIASSEMEFFQEQIRILEEKGVECDVIYATSRSTDKHAGGDGLKSKLFNSVYGHNPAYYALRGATFQPEVFWSSISDDYDLVHVNSGMVSPIGLLQAERPIVLTLWGDDLLGDRLYGYQSSITKQCAKRYAARIVRSQEMENELPCDAHIIPSGVDLEKFSPVAREEALTEVGWETGKKHVMFPYHPSQSKKRYPVAKEIVEDVNDRVDDHVQLQTVHGVPHERMNLYYSAADALILPSLREGSPNTVKEAMACNLPIVSTDVGDVQERVGPVKNSFACEVRTEMADKLHEIVESDDRSDGREYVEQVSLDTMGDRIISIYEELI